MTTPAQVRRAFLKAVWEHTKSKTLVRECKEIYDSGERKEQLFND